MSGGTRTVTVLFTDIVGSTELMARIGSAAATELGSTHFESLRRALAVHRGSEVKTLGDGLMAVFESAADSLACAVTMQQLVVNDPVQRQQHLRMRVGISAGEVTAEKDDFFGGPVVEANRLCDAAGPNEILVGDVVRMLVGWHGMHDLEPIAPLELKGIPAPVSACRLTWDGSDDAPLRVALADDAVLLRQGIASVLDAAGIEVVLQADDADTLLAGLDEASPDVVILDVRMPPTHTTEGLDAAVTIRAESPDIGVIVLSAEVQQQAARRLLDESTEGVGYLLKDRVGDIEQLTTAIRTVASGGSAIDPAVVERLDAVG
jgi:class 3 adenylate cyclase/CheY-like chemotaxis protein